MLACVVAVSSLLTQTVVPAFADSGDRTLYLYHTHSRETGKFTFKRNGRYDAKALADLNHFLRDWRNDKQTKMDPALFDLLWGVYQKAGATQPINIVSSFRSPETNEKLRSKPGSGVAENSQHTKGHAMDFFIPGVPLTKLRELAFREQVGGVGYYPTSGSPFVHLDTGNVRAWPRMTRTQLAKVFPDGKTLHLPTDGKPLSQTGRQFAQAEWTKCHRVPCNGSVFVPQTVGSPTMLASADAPQPVSPSRTVVGMMFGDKSPAAVEPVAGSAAPAQLPVAPVQVAVAASAPIPVTRTGNVGGQATVAAVEQDMPEAIPFSTIGSAPLAQSSGQVAPQPAVRSETIRVASGASTGVRAETAVTALASIGQVAPQPQSRVLMSAYAPEITPDPEAERALQMIIERETASSEAAAEVAPKPALPPTTTLRTASLGGPAGVRAGGLFDATFEAVNSAAPASVVNALEDMTAGKAASVGSIDTSAAGDVELIAPDLDHVGATMVLPVAMNSAQFGFLYDLDEGRVDSRTELGAFATRITRGMDSAFGLSDTSFTTGTPLFAAAQ